MFNVQSVGVFSTMLVRQAKNDGILKASRKESHTELSNVHAISGGRNLNYVDVRKIHFSANVLVKANGFRFNCAFDFGFSGN